MSWRAVEAPPRRPGSSRPASSGIAPGPNPAEPAPAADARDLPNRLLTLLSPSLVNVDCVGARPRNGRERPKGAHPEPSEIDSLCDGIATKTTAALEACSFQDLTGQRINKIVGSMKFVEERVNVMADLCGREEVQALTDQWELPQQVDDGVALDGPQRAGVGISQDEIDQLFN